MKFPLSGLSKQRADERKARLYRSLIHYEARIGGELFGPIPEGHRREFFCLDNHTWVWHEEWLDEKGAQRSMTTRYDVRPDRVLKSQGHMQYQALSPAEERNFFRAVRLYGKRVDSEYSRMLGASA